MDGMGQSMRKSTWNAILVVALLAVSTTPTSAGVRGGRGNQGNPGIAPPFASPGGASYGEWAARWWQWTLQTPASEHPFVLGDCDASVNDDEDVRFLPPIFGDAPIEYQCMVSSGKALFFPMLNLFYGAFLNDPPETRTEEFLRAQVTCSDVEISASIDGVPVNNPLAYLEDSPLFDVQLPEDNIFGVGPDVVPELLLSPSVDRGYYLYWVSPKLGRHEINVSGSAACPFGELGVSVTYDVTVVPGE